MNPDHYHLEFYADPGGREPVREWLVDLRASDRPKHAAIMLGLQAVLAKKGLDVCGTDFGKALNGGLYEFRLRHTEEELHAHLGLRGPERPPSWRGRKVLLRVFFTVYGDKVVLLLGAYDKGRQPSAKRQRAEIERARARLRAHRAQRGAHPSPPGPPEDRVRPEHSFLIFSRALRKRRD